MTDAAEEPLGVKPARFISSMTDDGRRGEALALVDWKVGDNSSGPFVAK